MRDKTPKKFRCWPAHCPAIIEVTPSDMKCAISMACPSIYEQEDGFLIIGKKVDLWPQEIAERVGKDEFLVWVPKGMVKPGDE